MARLVQFIEVVRQEGDGTAENPIKNIVQFWSLDGKLIFEIDPAKNGIQNN